MPGGRKPPDRREQSATVAVAATAAQLFVSDIRASCEFFTQKLGFSVNFVFGDPPVYAQVRRGGGILNLRHVDSPVIEPERRDREELLSADLGIETEADLSRLFREFEGAGVTIHRPLTKHAWGATTFVAKDRDGNLLLFAAPSE